MKVAETWQLLRGINTIALTSATVTGSDARACLHALTHVCADTTGLRFSWQVVCCWQDEAVTVLAQRCWAETNTGQQSEISFQSSNLNFPLKQSHSSHCFHNNKMCFWQAICSCFHIQTFYIDYTLLGGRDTGFGQLRLQLLYMMHLSTWWSLPYSLWNSQGSKALRKH